MFMNIMDGTVVNVALPTLSRYFGAPIGSVSGVVTAYLVALAVAMPASGWVGDRFGGRNVLLGAIGLFTAASALCGVATSLPELVAFRALQGLGGGMLVPVGMTMITRVFPPAERIKANQILVIPTLLAPALGPVIGGALVDGLSWRWIFYINLPVGLAAVAVGAARSEERRVGKECRSGWSPYHLKKKMHAAATRPRHADHRGRNCARRNRTVDFFFSSRRRHTRLTCDWSSDVCSSDLGAA